MCYLCKRINFNFRTEQKVPTVLFCQISLPWVYSLLFICLIYKLEYLTFSQRHYVIKTCIANFCVHKINYDKDNYNAHIVRDIFLSSKLYLSFVYEPKIMKKVKFYLVDGNKKMLGHFSKPGHGDKGSKTGTSGHLVYCSSVLAISRC